MESEDSEQFLSLIVRHLLLINFINDVFSVMLTLVSRLTIKYLAPSQTQDLFLPFWLPLKLRRFNLFFLLQLNKLTVSYDKIIHENESCKRQRGFPTIRTAVPAHY